MPLRRHYSVAPEVVPVPPLFSCPHFRSQSNRLIPDFIARFLDSLLITLD